MKKTVRKILLLMISLCVLSAALPQMTFAADTQPPKVTSLKLNKNLVSPGDKITITCKIKDASKIKKAVISFRNGDHYTKDITLKEKKPGVFKATYKVPKTLINGTYCLGYLYVRDSKKNEYVTYDPNDFRQAYFRVTGASQDKTPPVVKSLTIDKTKVSPGDQVTVRLEIEDENKLDTSIESSYLYLKNGSLLSKPFLFVKKSKSVYIATQTIPKTYVNGTYKISELVLTDTAGNTFSSKKKSELPELKFTVKGASKDKTAPVVKKLSFDKRKVKVGDTIHLTLRYKDDSAISLKRLNSYILFTNGVSRTGLITFKKKSDGVLEAEIPVTSSFLKGTYKLEVLRLTDSEGNVYQTNGTEEFPKASFTVKDGKLRGWYKKNGKWYFNDDYGKKVTGWLYNKKRWYYLDANSGVMKTGWVTVNKKKYYLNPSTGAMETGWKKVKGSWYYLDPASGAMKTGWIYLNGNWYFLKPDGKMAEKEWYGGYWFNADGTWTYPYLGSWKRNSIGWWFGDTSGWYARNGVARINNVEYRFNAAGYWY